ncbi:MAG: baseplate J/gp47 family protein [Candidatus Woesearchaeota archaeon]
MDFREKIINDLTQDGLDTTPNSIVDDLFIRKYLELNEPINQKIEEIKKRLFFEEFMNLKDEDKELFAGNFFINVTKGEKAEGTVRLFFDNPRDFFVQNETVFFTDDELLFLAKGNHSITAEEMSTNISGMYYYQEILVEAESVGEEYNIEPEKINNTREQNILNETVKIENPFEFKGGEDIESFEQLYKRIPRALSTRNMANDPGINSVLKNEFKATIDKIYPVRTGHEYMKRDIIVINDEEYRVGNMFDLWIKSNALSSYATIISKGDSNIIPFGYSLNDFYEGEENYIVKDIDEEPVDKIVFYIKEVRAISLDGTVSDPIEFIFKQKNGYENSVKQQSTIEIVDKYWKNISAQLQIEYFSSSLINRIQTFSLDGQNRLPVGDALIKHFVLKKIYGIINYEDDNNAVDTEEAEEKINTYLKNYTNDKTIFKISDVVSEIYNIGATKVQMPLELYMNIGTKKYSDSFVSVYDEFVNLSNENLLPNSLIVNQEINIEEEITVIEKDGLISLERTNIIPNSLEIEGLLIDEDFTINYETGTINMISDGNAEENTTYLVSYKVLPQENYEYIMDYKEGQIKILSQGKLDDDTEYQLEYGYDEIIKIKDEYEFIPYETILPNITLNKV